MLYNPELEIITETEIAIYAHDPALSLIQLTWQQHPNSEQYRNVYQTGINIALKYNLKFWLTNSKKVIILDKADQYWLYKNIGSLLDSGDLTKFAIVMNLSTFLSTDISPINFNSEIDQSEERINNFNILFDLESVYKWLLEFSIPFKILTENHLPLIVFFR